MAEVRLGVLVSHVVIMAHFSEIIFNPLRYWFTRGPFTKLFRTFLWSPIPAHSKFGIMAYMFSYYAISSAWIGSIISFILIGVFAWADTFCEY